jgi:16S rRNA G966 N2-methylase RsmD
VKPPTVKLHYGDCMKLLKKVPDASVDLVLVDPPYGKTALSWDVKLPIQELWREYRRICRSNAPVIFTATQPFTTSLIVSNPAMFRYCMVWDKGKGSNPLLSSKRPMSSHEDIVVFYRSQPVYNPQMTDGTPYKSPRTGGGHTNSVVGAPGSKVAGTEERRAARGGFIQKTKDTSKRFPLSVLPFSIHCGSKLHPSQKPVALMEWLVRTYTDHGATVLDTCMGSGTTGVAAVNCGRSFIGVEQDKRYFLMAKERIEEARRYRMKFPETEEVRKETP